MKVSVNDREFIVNVHGSEFSGFWAYVINLPGCVTQSNSFLQIEQNIIEAIKLHLKSI